MMQWQSRHLSDACFNDIWKCKIDGLSTDVSTFATDSREICPEL